MMTAPGPPVSAIVSGTDPGRSVTDRPGDVEGAAVSMPKSTCVSAAVVVAASPVVATDESSAEPPDVQPAITMRPATSVAARRRDGRTDGMEEVRSRRGMGSLLSSDTGVGR